MCNVKELSINFNELKNESQKKILDLFNVKDMSELTFEKLCKATIYFDYEKRSLEIIFDEIGVIKNN